jgi:hypothetical protein
VRTLNAAILGHTTNEFMFDVQANQPKGESLGKGIIALRDNDPVPIGANPIWEPPLSKGLAQSCSHLWPGNPAAFALTMSWEKEGPNLDPAEVVYNVQYVSQSKAG